MGKLLSLIWSILRSIENILSLDLTSIEYNCVLLVYGGLSPRAILPRSWSDKKLRNNGTVRDVDAKMSSMLVIRDSASWMLPYNMQRAMWSSILLPLCCPSHPDYCSQCLVSSPGLQFIQRMLQCEMYWSWKESVRLIPVPTGTLCIVSGTENY